MNEEGLQKTANKLIYIGKQIQIDSTTFAMKLRILRDAALKNNEKIAVDALHEMVPTFVTPEEFNRHELEKRNQLDAQNQDKDGDGARKEPVQSVPAPV